ncbi:asparagine synthase (glutamine-hydrolyzing) [Streptomyces cinnamoneus]|uniref:asparagine synthase (glutamine-hydrolyzing) n=1 Tax=Streptomyces cinnamoneus TaxID=53446 RepID=A0A918T8Z7_STRCJ|nr:asparagine synthase (glutamine-hydrolyzing) [Streptomyces cinnamoneus]GHC32158.1 asparagine synthetase B [Streptomyces cinnamoneus]
MCRIIGHLGARLSADSLRAAAGLQRAGGPDAQYLAARDGWALGANRLAVMAPQGGRQPYSLGTGIHVVYNGEIYNHRDLRRRLAGFGHRVDDDCDGAVLPALYAHYGDGFAEHLDGMFAIAVIDLRNTPRLVLATDGAGMKPLYYHWDPAAGSLLFASELPALLALPGVPRVPRLSGLDDYLTTKTPFGDETMYEEVRALPAATDLVFEPGRGMRLHRRGPARAEPFPGGPAGPPATLEAAGAHVRNLLRAETGRLAEADAPVCAVVSGGLDSSLVTALLAERIPSLHSFTICYRGTWPFDERAFAAEAARHAGTVHHEVEADPAEFVTLLPDVVARLGQPNADPITVSSYALFRAIREAGFTVALTGDGADEVFLGYRRMQQALTGGADWQDAYVDSLAAVPGALREELYSSEYRDWLRAAGSSEDRLRRRLADRLAAVPGDAAPGSAALAALTALELDERLPAYHLRRVDHLSMAHSVEVRLPFCQPGVQRTATALPQPWKLTARDDKRALREAARGLVPDSVLQRPKQPFTLPITAMLRDGLPLMEYARDLLSPEDVRRDGQLDAAAVQRLLRRQEERPDDTTALAVWALMIHRTWRAQLAAPALTGARAA